MLLRACRSRHRPFFSAHSLLPRPYSSNVSANSPAAASAADHAQCPPTDATPAPAKWSSTLLKLGAFGTLAGTTAVAGYATYAYSTEDIDEKTRAFRVSTNYTAKDDASVVDKFQALLYSASMTLPAKAIDIYLDLRRSIEIHVQSFTDPSAEVLLPDLHPVERPHVFTLVVDLNETLVYSDWKRERGWRTFKRPGVDAFLEHLAQFYEIVVYSDQPSMYVDPIIERLDGKGFIRYRLSRSATRYQDGKHYRDLSKLNRDPSRVLYISAHALESSLQPENCVPVKPWKLEADDTALLDLIPFLEYVARHKPQDIRQVLSSYDRDNIAREFIERSKEHQRRMQGQKQQSFFRLR